MEGMTVKDLAAACGGTLLQGREDMDVTGISINSREVTKGDLFVPLIGERVDAHRFIGQAIEAGAAAVLASRKPDLEDSLTSIIRVEDTLRALQDIGREYRKRLAIPLVGITGSVGKTTTREMAAAALSAGLRVYQTRENYNSQVGVPMSLTEISAKDQAGVIELGMSLPGELTVIAQIAQVDMAIITNIGESHIGQLGSLENICREKLRIQDGLKPGGVLFLNGEDEWLKSQKAKEGCRTVYYGFGENCQYRAQDVSTEGGYSRFTAVCRGKRIPVKLQALGRHQVLNAIGALAIAEECGVPLEAAAKKLEEFKGVKGRMQIYETETMMVIDDTYNASPISMEGALDALGSMGRWKRRIAVLADMKELGPGEVGFHREVGKYLGKKNVDVLVAYGDLAREIAQGAAMENPGLRILHFSEGTEKEAMKRWLVEELGPGDCVLLKGSNSMKLGEVAAYVRQHYH